MATAVIPSRPSYDTVIAQQQARIAQLESDLARYSDKLAVLRARTSILPISAPPIPDAFNFARQAAAAAAASPPPHALAAAAATEEDDRAGKTRYWTEMEHNQFLFAVKLFGSKNYVAISQFVGTRTPKQVRTHAQKYQMKLEREARKRRTAPAVPAAGSPLAHALAAHLPTLPAGAQTEEQAAALSAAAHAAAAAHVAAAAHAAQATQAVSVGSCGVTESATTTVASPMSSPESSVPAASPTTSIGETCLGKKPAGVDVGGMIVPTATTTALDFLRDSASSPVSMDDMEEDEEVSVDVGVGGSKPTVVPSHACGLTADMPPPGPLGAGFRKNASLTNLADYDDFMRKITAAVNDRDEHTGMMFDHTPSFDVECDDLETPVKTEHFEDSLLADM